MPCVMNFAIALVIVFALCDEGVFVSLSLLQCHLMLVDPVFYSSLDWPDFHLVTFLWSGVTLGVYAAT